MKNQGNINRSGKTINRVLVFLVLFIMLGAVMFAPDSAEANFNNFAGNPCTNCHTNILTTGTNAGLDVRIAIDGVETVTANVNDGDWIEVDFFNWNVMGTGDKSEGHFIEVPTGWGPVNPGTANAKPAGWTAWHSSWDAAGGTVNGWTQEYTNTLLWTTRTANGTNWGAGATGTMCNDADGASGGDKCDDLDLSLYHGSDFQIQIPPGTGTGTYFINMTFVGHEDGGTKGNYPQQLTINVAGAAVSQTLDSFTDDSADSGAPITDLRMAKIATTAVGGGAGLTASQVTVSGTLSALTDIKVWWNTVDNFGTATQVGSDSSPVVDTPSNITLTGAGSASGFLYYTISIPGGATGTYDAQVSSVTGSTSDTIPLPQTTATRSVTVIPTQELDTFTDDSANTNAPVTDLRMGKITTSATNGGANLSQTQVTVNGTLSALTDVKVWWNTVDDFGTASQVGSDLSPTIGLASTISLSGAGSASGFLYYTITLPAGATGNYDVTVNSMTGHTADNIALPQTTATQDVNTQELDTFTDDSADSGAPVTDLQMAKITTTGTGTGANLSQTQVTVSGTLSALSDIRVWWNTVDNFGTASEVGSDLAPTIGLTSTISLTGAGGVSGFLYYSITMPGGATGNYSVTVDSVTGQTADNITLPQTTATRNVTIISTQTLDVWTDDSADASAPVTDLQMAKITTNATSGGAALTASQVTVNGTLSALTDIKVWWNTTDDFGTASQVGSDTSPTVNSPSNITLTGAGSATGYLYYTITIPNGATGSYDVQVSSVTGSTTDNISLPQTTAARNVNTGPAAVTGLGQFKSDSSTPIAAGRYTNELTVIIKGTVTDPEGDQVQLQIEMVDVDGSFTGTPGGGCTPDGFVNSGTEATATCGLGSGQFKWKARGDDINGNQGIWTDY